MASLMLKPTYIIKFTIMACQIVGISLTTTCVLLLMLTLLSSKVPEPRYLVTIYSSKSSGLKTHSWLKILCKNQLFLGIVIYTSNLSPKRLKLDNPVFKSSLGGTEEYTSCLKT